MRKRWLSWCLVVACLFGLASCSQEDFPVTVEDTVISALPVRVVSLSPLTTEMLDAIGAAAHLVGRSEQCDYPPVAAGQPDMGTALNPDVDAIIESGATLVLTASPLEADAMLRLDAHGIAVLCLSAGDSLEEVRANYVALATAMGGANQGPGNGERAYSMLQERLESVSAAVEDQPPVKACYLMDVNTPAPSQSVVGVLLQAAGAENTAAGETWAEDTGAAAQAEVIFCDMELVDSVTAAPAYAASPAVKNGRVVGIDSAQWQRQGLRLAEAAAQMALALHPGCDIPNEWDVLSSQGE